MVVETRGVAPEVESRCGGWLRDGSTDHELQRSLKGIRAESRCCDMLRGGSVSPRVESRCGGVLRCGSVDTARARVVSPNMVLAMASVVSTVPSAPAPVGQGVDPLDRTCRRGADPPSDKG